MSVITTSLYATPPSHSPSVTSRTPPHRVTIYRTSNQTGAGAITHPFIVGWCNRKNHKGRYVTDRAAGMFLQAGLRWPSTHFPTRDDLAWYIGDRVLREFGL